MIRNGTVSDLRQPKAYMLKGTVIETGYYKILQTRIVPKLIDLNLTPNHITCAGLLMSVVAGVCFAYLPFLGGLVTLLTGLLDSLDGALARATGQSRKFGAFLDSVTDRYTELLTYLGIWFYMQRTDAPSAYPLLIMLILFGSLMVSYTRARAEGLGERCMGGIFQRGERIILLGVAGILNPIINLIAAEGSIDLALKGVLIVLALGTNLTAMWRFMHVLNKLKKKV
jgi:CDP-diacylglycerol--glycerol-3-phosphate 3-phosphatidyltransferase